MNTGLLRYSNIVPLLAAVAAPFVLGACSSSSSSAPPPAPPALPVATLAGDVANNEGDSGTSTITFTVQLDKNADGPVTVDYATADGTATAGTDYVAASGSTTISPAQTSRTIDVTINGDLKFEADETLTLSITSVSSNVTLGTVSSATGTITNDDSAPFVVFMADKDADEVIELYKHSVDTGTTQKVNLPLSGAFDVRSFAISPDHQWIAYISDQGSSSSGIFNLFVRDAALANPPVQLSTILPAGTSVSVDAADKPVWAPDSSRVAYRHNANTSLRFELNTATPDGMSNVTVSDILDDGRNVQPGSFDWSPDSSRVAYIADRDAVGNNELYTNTGGGGSHAKINSNLGTLAGTRAVTDYAWSPDSTRLAYRADEGATDDQFTISSAPAAGGSSSEVADIIGIPGANTTAAAYAWSPDSSRIAFVADRVGTSAVFSIHTAPGDGSATPVQIDNGTGNAYDVVGIPTWAPDGSRVAYIADINQNDVFELFTSVPTTAGSTTINGTPPLGGNVSTGQATLDSVPAWSPVSSSLIYAAEQDTAGILEIYVGPGDGSGSATGNTKVSGTMVPNGDADLSQAEIWAPDGSQILYVADQDLDGTFSLWTSTPAGGNNTKLTSATPATASHLTGVAKWSHESSYVAYASEQTTAAVVELFISTPAGAITPVSGTLVGGGNVDATTFEWAP